MTKEKQKLRIIPVGGLDAIGRNMTLFEYGEDIIIVDCGIMFPTDEMPGVDFLIPDFSYVVKNRHRVKAILITHGHEDHIGAIPFLLQEINAPIYATKIALGLIQKRLEEKPTPQQPVYVEISPRDVVHIESFVVEFIRVNHSIIDGVGLAIQTPVGIVIHTGDYKIDFSPVDGEVTDLYRFADYGERGVLLLMSDSTNAERPGYTRSESVLNPKLIEIFSSSKGRIIVASFASNISRIQQVLNVAQRYNKKIVVSGLTMQKNIEIAKSLGYLSFRDDLIVSVKEAEKLPDKRIVIICTGTQGEPMSALSRMANGTHKHFAINSGDTVVITASIIPGNDRLVNNIINALMILGADVYYEQDEDIHVSGHGSQEELKLMISLTKPRYFMPIHGEFKQRKAHAWIAESLNIKPSRIIMAQNGSVIEMTGKSFDVVETLKLGEIFIDGSEIGDMESGLIKERQVMSTDGMVVVTVIVSGGRLLLRPDVVSRGFAGHRAGDVVDLIRKDVEEHCEKMLADGAKRKDIANFIKRNLRNYVFKITRRNPMIEVQVIEV
ncbi:MAG TPA: ribonuclease J [Spirochaetota bacterium]|nr:ribonuclease J [Spirochaetota bacterium]HPJ39289.1 ribonuclease J [Spirochaetota bacterium]HPQ53055.1 ribonuclease J [Spirochaetota bacterium]